MDNTDAASKELGPETSDQAQVGLAQLRASLQKHLSDGRFTDQELQVARAQRRSLGLSAKAVRTLRADVFHSKSFQVEAKERLRRPPVPTNPGEQRS